MDIDKLIEKIENDLRNIRFDSLVNTIILHLQEIERVENEAVGLPWLDTSLLQIAINCTNPTSRNSPFLKQIDKADFNRLLKNTQSIYSQYLLRNYGFSDRKTTAKTMQILLYQQIWRHNKNLSHDLGRQVVLFLEIDQANNSGLITKLFKDKFGLSIFNFLRYSAQIYSTQINGRLCDYFDTCNEFLNGYLTEGEDEIKAYFQALTLGYKTPLKDDLRSISKFTHSPFLYILDPTPWFRKPFIFHEQKIKILSRSLLHRAVSNFIFTSLKSNPVFESTFSIKVMEPYIEKGLREVNLEYTTENELIQQRGRKLKVVDFIVDDSVLIECKATEPDVRAVIMPDDKKIRRSIKTSILKGLTQMYQFIKEPSDKDFYGIIVTYERMHLLETDALAEGPLAKDLIQRLGLSKKQLKALPLNRIFIIPLSDWDDLLLALKHQNCTLKEILTDIVRKNDKNKQYFFTWIENFIPKNSPRLLSFVKKAYLDFVEKI